MKKLLLIPLLGFALLSFSPLDFIGEQLKFPRVRQAKAEKGAVVNELLSSNGINKNDFNLFIRGFKDEKTLEIWVKNSSDKTYKLLKTYESCASSGVLGPKRRSGDKQTPEGFYIVDRFNPYSNHFLSFRLSYPNESDLHFADVLNPGDNIFIHGNCITIGCIPIGNDNIKELYLLAAMARGAADVDIHMFPTRLSEAGLSKIAKGADADLVTFWKNLQPGYAAFEKSKSLPTITVGEDGRYIVN